MTRFQQWKQAQISRWTRLSLVQQSILIGLIALEATVNRFTRRQSKRSAVLSFRPKPSPTCSESRAPQFLAAGVVALFGIAAVVWVLKIGNPWMIGVVLNPTTHTRLSPRIVSVQSTTTTIAAGFLDLGTAVSPAKRITLDSGTIIVLAVATHPWVVAVHSGDRLLINVKQYPGSSATVRYGGFAQGDGVRSK